MTSTPVERPLSAVPSPFEIEAPVGNVEIPRLSKYSSGTEEDTAGSDTIYQFEGKNVLATKAAITSVADLEIADAVLRVDEYVRVEVECRVVNVNHKVNNKTGHLERVHLLKAVDSKILPWAVE